MSMCDAIVIGGGMANTLLRGARLRSRQISARQRSRACEKISSTRSTTRRTKVDVHLRRMRVVAKQLAPEAETRDVDIDKSRPTR